MRSLRFIFLLILFLVPATLRSSVAISVAPSSATVLQKGTQTFVASVSGTSNTAVTWKLLDNNSGTVSRSGVYTAPSVSGAFVLRVTCKADPNVYFDIKINVPQISVSIFPTDVNLLPGTSITFSGLVAGAASAAFKWSCSGGKFSGNVYTAPSVLGAYTITCTSSQDTTRTATATANVINAASAPSSTITLSPSSVILSPGCSVFITASVKTSGGGSGSLIWNATSGNIKLISENCILYTAPPVAGNYTISVRTAADPRPEHNIIIPVVVSAGGGGIPAGTAIATDSSLSVFPDIVNLMVGQKIKFAALYNGNMISDATWKVSTSNGQGSISNDGVFCATMPGTYNVTAYRVDTKLYYSCAIVNVYSTVTDAGIDNLPYVGELLNDGRILFVGGDVATKNAIIFNPDGAPRIVSVQTVFERTAPSVFCNDAGNALIHGGRVVNSDILNTVEVFDPISNTFSVGPSIVLPVTGCTNNEGTSFTANRQLDYPVTYGWQNATGEHYVYNMKTYANSFGVQAFSSGWASDGEDYPNVGAWRGGYQRWFWGYWDPTRMDAHRSSYLAKAVELPLLDKNTLQVTNNTYNHEFWYGPNWFMAPGLTAGVQIDPGDNPYVIYHHSGERYTSGVLLRSGVILCRGEMYKHYYQFAPVPIATGGYIEYCDVSTPTDSSTLMTSWEFSLATKAFRRVGKVLFNRAKPSYAELNDGRVLVTGGWNMLYPNNDNDNGATKILPPAAEIYDPVTSEWRLAGSMNYPRYSHGSAVLQDGRVLIVGGYSFASDGSKVPVAVNEIYDPITDLFSVSEDIGVGMQSPTIYVTKSGKIFVSGYMLPVLQNQANKQTALTNQQEGIIFYSNRLLQIQESSPELVVDFATINQGVERYINNQKQKQRTWDSTNLAVKPEMVPIIEGRAAIITIYLKSIDSIGRNIVGRNIKIIGKLEKGGQQLPSVDITIPASNRFGTSDPQTSIQYVLTSTQMVIGQKILLQMISHGMQPGQDHLYLDVTVDLGLAASSNAVTIKVYGSKYYNDRASSPKDVLGNPIPDVQYNVSGLLEAFRGRWKAMLPVRAVEIIDAGYLEFDRTKLVQSYSDEWSKSLYFEAFLNASHYGDAVGNKIDTMQKNNIALVLMPPTKPDGSPYIRNSSNVLIDGNAIKFAGATQPVWSTAVIFMKSDGEEHDYGGITPGRVNSVHEMGHVFGSNHAPCGLLANDPYVDAEWPHSTLYQNGIIGARGWDIRQYSAQDPQSGYRQSTSPDVMSACGNQWISDFNFTKWWIIINK